MSGVCVGGEGEMTQEAREHHLIYIHRLPRLPHFHPSLLGCEKEKEKKKGRSGSTCFYVEAASPNDLCRMDPFSDGINIPLQSDHLRGLFLYR